MKRNSIIGLFVTVGLAWSFGTMPAMADPFFVAFFSGAAYFVGYALGAGEGRIRVK